MFLSYCRDIYNAIDGQMPNNRADDNNNNNNLEPDKPSTSVGHLAP